MATKRLTMKDKRRLRTAIVERKLYRLRSNANSILDGLEDVADIVLSNSYPSMFKRIICEVREQLPGTALKYIFDNSYTKTKVQVGDGYILEVWGNTLFDDIPECHRHRKLDSTIYRYKDFVKYAEEHYNNYTMFQDALNTFDTLVEYSTTAGQLNRAAPYLMDFVSDEIKDSLGDAKRASKLHHKVNGSVFAAQSERLHTALAVASLLEKPKYGSPIFDVTRTGVVESDSG